MSIYRKKNEKKVKIKKIRENGKKIKGKNIKR